MRGIAAILLAAGGSTRLGRPKQLVTAGGRSLVRRAVDTARSADCRPIIVVVGLDEAGIRRELAESNATIVPNEDWPRGMGTSLRAGFAALPRDTTAAVLLLCDQPLVTAETIKRLQVAAETSGRPVCVAEYADTVGPPLLVRGDALRQLRAWPAADGAKRLWLDRPEDVCRVPCPEAATDVDTEGDVIALGRLLGETPHAS